MRTRLLSILLGIAIIGAAFLVPGPQTADAAKDHAKAVICHHGSVDDNDNLTTDADEFHTISVSAKALPAHKKHGDTLGPCAVASPSPGAQVIKIDSGALIESTLAGARI